MRRRPGGPSAVLVVVVALVVALWRQLGRAPDPTAAPGRTGALPGSTATPTPRRRWPGRGHAPICRRVRRRRRRPGRRRCAGSPSSAPATARTIDVARALAGRPVVLNLWAYWCGPCAEELPAMAEYQRRVGSAVTVLTVHQDENETAGAAAAGRAGRAAADVAGRAAPGRGRAARCPNVMPATVVLRPDGSVAEILPRPFANADEIAAAVGSTR